MTRRGHCCASNVADTFSAVAQRFDALNRELTGEGATKVAQQLGKLGQGDAVKAVRNDWHRDHIKNWRKAKFTTGVKVQSPGAVTVGPSNQGVGVWKVAEKGRHHGDSNRFQGPGVNVKTGETSRLKSGKLRTVKARKGRRWNGYTDPKGTWSDAEELIAKATPKRTQALVNKALIKSKVV